MALNSSGGIKFSKSFNFTLQGHFLGLVSLLFLIELFKHVYSDAQEGTLGDSIFLIKGKKMSGEGMHRNANNAIAGMKV